MSYLSKLREMDNVEIMDDGIKTDISVDSLKKWHNHVYRFGLSGDAEIFYNKGKGSIGQGKLFGYRFGDDGGFGDKLSLNELVRLDEFGEVMELIKED